MRVLATAEVLIVKYAEALAPAVTETDAGSVTLGSLLVKFTVTPTAGAGPFNVTLFNVVEAPPTTEVGDSVTEDGASGFTVRFADLVMPSYVAEIATTSVLVTVEVAIVKYGETLDPALTMTDGGTATLGSPLVKVTVAPPAGAGPFSVTLVNVVEVPAPTELGDSVTETGTSGFTVRFAVFTAL
jgi:hypothetical protein